jgi:Rad3-related DNA helicase
VPVYRGFRGQERAGIRVTEGIFASEGVGVYIALDPGLAREFVRSRGYIQELEFRLDRPLVVGKEPLYILDEADELEDPVQDSDSDWLEASKLAYQTAVKETNNNWSQAQYLVGQFLTNALQAMGYDGVIVDQGKNNRWAVVFDPENVQVLKAEKQAHVSREVRLAKVLIYSKVV